MTVQRGPHRYLKDTATTRPGCYLCGENRFHRNHQPLWWRIRHPLAKSR